jgi:hypothetical protein
MFVTQTTPKRRAIPLAHLLIGLVVALTGVQIMAQTPDTALNQALETVRKVDSHGAGHEDAVKAMQILNTATPAQVPLLLSGMKDTNQLAQNWIRGAIQSALGHSGEFPKDSLLKFLQEDLDSNDMGRLVAWELLVADTPALTDELLPKMLNDSSLPLRQLSVEWHISKADAAGEGQSFALLVDALVAARDVNQIQKIADKLATKGVNIDLHRQLGFINTWKIAGPFDNKGEKGFAVALGPETSPGEIDPEAVYKDGLDGAEIKWKEVKSVDATATVNLNEVLGKIKGATAYAYAEFDAMEDAECEIRIGCINANKVWLNGEPVLANEVYHVGMMPDQFSGKGKLVKGKNRILFKICQNEQEQPWAQEWMFQLRICNPDGSAILPVKPEPVQM